MSINSASTSDNSVPLLYANQTDKRAESLESFTKTMDSTKGGGKKKDGDKAVETKNMLGTFDGCYVPCLLNILGVILFLKLGWGVGTAGVVGMCIIFAIAELLCVLTVLSLSAILTNGTMAGGGAYFMISRSLGPEFGGAIGTLFYIANAFGASFYFIGFAEGLALFDFVQEIFCENVADPSTDFCIESINFNRLAGLVSLLLCFIVSWVGADAFTKVNVPLFILQALTVAIGLGSYLVPFVRNLGIHNTTVPACQVDNYTDIQSCEYSMTNISYSSIVIGFDNSTGNFFAENWAMPSADGDKLWPYPNQANLAACPQTSSANHPNIYQRCSLLNVFSIIFPAVTGIMVGSNLSGDLKDPSRAIPEGTFWAMFTSFLMYMALIFTMGYSFSTYTLMYNGGFWQEATWLGGIPIVVGVIVASLSSGLGALFGGSRILQAMSRDDLFPKQLECINVFGYGSPKGDEPHYALILTAVISLIGVGIANLDSIASMITSFYLLTYAIVNFTCFFLSITGAPNFRPTWKYFTWHTALLGGLLNLAVLFLTSWVFALISIAAMVAIVILLNFSGKTKDWGDVSQALVYHQVRKFLLLLDSADKGHSKFWRPSFLVLVDDMHRPYNLFGCLETLKKGGLLVFGGVVIGDLPQMADARDEMRTAWLDVISKCALKAFVQIGIANDVRAAYRLLISCAGLGGLDTNTVVVPLFRPAEDLMLEDGDETDSTSDGFSSDATGGPARKRTTSYYKTVTRKISKLQNMSPSRRGKVAEDVDATEDALEEGTAGGHDDDDASDEGVLELRAPAVNSALEWIGVLKDTLALKRNVLVETNFDTMEMDTSFPVSKRYRRGPTNKDKHLYVDAWLNFDAILLDHPVGMESFMDAVYVALREKAAAEKGEPAASELQASPSLRKVHGQAPAPPKPVTEGEYDAESGGYAADPDYEAKDDDDDGDVDEDNESTGETDGTTKSGLSFKDSSSLLLQLAFILAKSRKWARHSKLRVNVLYTNESDGEFTNDVLEEAIESHIRDFCHTIRVDVSTFRILNVSASAPSDARGAASLVSRCARVKSYVRNYCDKTCVALVPLPSFTFINDAAAAKNYCKALEALTEGLGPAFLVKFGEGVDVVTNVI